MTTRIKRWSGQFGVPVSGITSNAPFTNVLTDTFPSSLMSQPTLLHTRLQLSISCEGSGITPTAIPVSFAWDDIQLLVWTWLNVNDGRPDPDLGQTSAIYYGSDERLLSVNVLRPVQRIDGNLPHMSNSIYMVDDAVSVESRRLTAGGVGLPGVSVGLALFDTIGYFATGGVQANVDYETYGRITIRNLWEGTP